MLLIVENAAGKLESMSSYTFGQAPKAQWLLQSKSQGRVGADSSCIPVRTVGEVRQMAAPKSLLQLFLLKGISQSCSEELFKSNFGLNQKCQNVTCHAWKFSIQKTLDTLFPRSAQNPANMPWTQEQLFALCVAQGSKSDTGIQPSTSVKTGVTISV